MARRWARLALAASLATFVAACGEEEPQVPSGPPLAGLGEAARGGGGPRPPEVVDVRLEPADPVPGLPVHARVAALDPDGDPVRLRYRWFLNDRPLPARGDSFRLTSARKGDRLSVEVVASDGSLESPPVRRSVDVGNRPPVLLALDVTPSGEVEPGAALRATPEARDPDGDPLEYRYVWSVNGEPRPESDRVFSTEGLHRGDRITLRVVASDGDLESNALRGPELRIANAPPEIRSRPPAIDSTGVFRYRVEARDPDGDRNLRFALVEGPEGVDVDPLLGDVVWRPRPDQVGTHEIEVSVRDPQGATTSQRFRLSVRAAEPTAPAAAAP